MRILFYRCVFTTLVLGLVACSGDGDSNKNDDDKTGDGGVSMDGGLFGTDRGTGSDVFIPPGTGADTSSPTGSDPGNPSDTAVGSESGDTVIPGDAGDTSVSTGVETDSTGIIVDPPLGITVDEGGGTATFTVVLGTAPTADVSIALTNSAVGAVSLDMTTLVFTPNNWSAPQTVTLTGVDDAIADGDNHFVIITEPAVSADPNFNGVNGPNVEGTVVDDDTASVSILDGQGLTSSERGEASSFSVVLTSQPMASVTIPVASSDTTEGGVSTDILVFTDQDWNIPQTITVTGVDDTESDGDVTYRVVLGETVSDDVPYNGLNFSVDLVNFDDDAPNVLVNPIELTTSETGQTGQFAVELTMAPTADVTIPVTSSDTTEGTAAPASLVFTPDNWNTPQVVTVTGVDDTLVDGDVSYTIQLGSIASTDTAYAGIVPSSVSVTNVDDDAASVVVTPTSGLQTSEAGATSAFTVVLETEPAHSVSIALASSDTGEGTVDASAITFTPENWSTPQTVTVSGVDDAESDGPIAFTITTTAMSSDPAYDGVDVADASVVNLDDEVSTPAIFVTPTEGLQTTEAGATAVFYIALGSEPTSSVGLTLTVGDTSEGELDVTTLIFSASNWSTPQTITVTGLDDGIDDGDITYAISASVVSNDTDYADLVVPDVTVINTDDDEVGVTVAVDGILETTEYGAEAIFTVVLDCQPADTVIIPVSSSDEAEGIVDVTSLSFSTSSWDTPQTVAVTGVNDTDVDGDTAYTILLGAALSDDTAYDGLDPSDVIMMNLDNDPYVPCSNPNLIDDLEDGDLDICENGGRTGTWYAYNESDDGTQSREIVLETREDSIVAARTIGDDLDSWGATFGVILNGVNLDTRLAYDVSEYTGIRFWIRRGPDSSYPTTVTVNIVQENIANTDQGGTCDDDDDDCSDHYADSISVSSTWKQVSLPFSSFSQVGWGDDFPRDLENVLGFEFLVEYSSFDLMVDDLELY